MINDAGKHEVKNRGQTVRGDTDDGTPYVKAGLP